VIAHWDELEARAAELRHLGARWTAIGEAIGTRRVGVNRIEIEPERWSTPVHRQTAEEEIFFVLAGSGLLWQDGRTHEVGPGDCIVHRGRGAAHSLRGGPEGLDVLVFGTRVRSEIGHLPRAGVAWLGGTWVRVGEGDHPWEQEVAAGEPELPAPSDRPPNVVNVDECEPEIWSHADMGGAVRALGEAAGSQLTGLNHERIEPDVLNTPPHCHSAEEEVFVVLAGSGVCLLGTEEHEVRAGHAVARPAGTGVPHAFRGGEGGLTLLSYGTREPHDLTYYPRSGLVAFRGLNVVGRLEPAGNDEIR
jgi:uncharacterized cupin superfamily protein